MQNRSATILPLVAGLILAFNASLPVALAQTPAEAPVSSETPAPSEAEQAPADAPADRRFDILEYVVDGNSVLSVLEVEEAIYPFLGEGRGAADVDMAREALENIYRSKGYQTVQVAIPQQGIETGIIHLEVVENPVGRLRVVGSDYHSLEQIRQNAPSVAEGRVLNTQDVQRDIIALNQQPDLVVTPRLRAGAVPGTVDVDLEVEDELPVTASLEVNNQYSQSTSAVRLVGSVAYNNLWQLGHAISLTYQVAPKNPSDSEVLSGTYMFRLPRTPVSILAYAVQSDSDVAALASTNVVGRGTIFGARAIVNLPGTEGFFHSITAGVDRKNLTQNIITDGIASNATVLYYPLSITYAATWQEDERVTRANASLNFAAPLGSDSAKFDLQRFDALRQYIYVRGDVSHTQPLPRGFVVYGKLAGQFSGDPLLSSEQFSAGGANTVRGYLESERLGDYGAAATLELRSPNFGPRIAAPISEWRIHVFADGAAMSRRNPLPGEQVAFGIASAGIGTRFTAFDGFNGAFDFAYAMTDGLATDEGDTRLHFRLWSGF